MQTLWQDIKFGARILRRNPGFTVVAVLTLALGIGANTAIFSVVNGVLLQPLPYGEPDQIVRVFETTRGRPGRGVVSPANFTDWEERNEVFEYIAAMRWGNAVLTGAGEPVQLKARAVSPAFFRLMGVPPLLGRDFLREDAVEGKNKIAVLAYGLWQGRFGGNPDILDQTITLDGDPYKVVGVMPAGFQYPRDVQLWTPLVLTAEERSWRTSFFLSAIARLKPGLSLEQAQAGMDVLCEQLAKEYPKSNKKRRVNLIPLHTSQVEDIQSNLWLLLGAVGFVLLIACSNVANLLLARASVREKEIAVRSALGARRGRLVQQLLTESILVGGTGGALGLVFAWVGVRTLVAFSPQNFPLLEAVGVDLHVLGYTLGLSLLTGIAFGLAPALQSSRPDLTYALKEGSRTSGGGFSLRHHRLRNLLVVGEIALALVLLVGAGLLIRSFTLLISQDTGFQPDKLLSLELNLPRYKYPETVQQKQFFEQLVEGSKRVPGVISVAAVNALPFSQAMWMHSFRMEAADNGEDIRRSTDYKTVSGPYFQTIGIPLVQGRLLTDRDTGDAEPVVIVNEAFVREFSPHSDIIGRRIVISARPAVWSTIVGVVGDVRHYALNHDPRPTLYRPFAQAPTRSMMVVARTKSNPTALAAALRGQVHALDRDQPITRISTVQNLISNSIAPPRFYTLLLTLFAGVAIGLAAMGIFGVISYAVSQRTHEIGVRMALGARAPDILRMILKQGIWLTLVGVGIGLAGAFALTRFLESLLFGISATDPLTFVGVAALLTAVALLACYIPARRATKVDPMVALRYE